MDDILRTCLILLLFGSGFVLWPIYALLWRGKRRSSALRWVCLIQLAANFVVAGWALLSNIEDGYWFIVAIYLNLFFTPLALGAAIYDFAYSIRWAHMSPSEWRDTLHHLEDEYSRKLADPTLSASRRAELEGLIKELPKLIGHKSRRG